MKGLFKKILFLALACMPVIAAAQDIDAHSPHSKKDPIAKQQKKAEQKKAKQKAKAEAADRQVQKRAMKLQTKAVQKRMKKNKKKAEKWNQNKK